MDVAHVKGDMRVCFCQEPLLNACILVSETDNGLDLVVRVVSFIGSGADHEALKLRSQLANAVSDDSLELANPTKGVHRVLMVLTAHAGLDIGGGTTSLTMFPNGNAVSVVVAEEYDGCSVGGCKLVDEVVDRFCGRRVVSRRYSGSVGGQAIYT